jgi:zinc protease
MKNLLLLFAVFFSVSAVAQTRLIEKVEKTGDEIVIPYEKYQLDNGLTLIIHEDHSDPMVHVDVTYHVGSAREELKKSGFAHFFEHMMFQGSENVADEEHFKIITDAGGTLNGTTNRDRTNYFETVPVNQLETMLWLEADRMGFLLPAVTQQKFEVQRATVKNEKGQNYDNRPYGQTFEIIAAALYPYGHPYSWLTIGKLEDLDRVDVNDLKRFFLRWYGPNNATLTIGGDVKPKEVVKLVEKYFGNIPSGPEVEAMKLDAPVLESDRYVSYIDKNIRFPALVFTYPTVPRFHPDEAALDVLADILGGGRGSYFYKNFVANRKAIQAQASHPASELAGEFQMFVLPFPGQTLADFETAMRQILEDFEKDGVSEEDVAKFKATYESSTINGLQSVSGKVSQLASYETFYGNPDAIKFDLERYMKVTKEDVMRVFKKYVKGKSAVIMSVVPNEETAPAKPDNYEIPTDGDNPFPMTDYSGLEYERPSGDKVDRSKRPEVGPNPLANVPEFWKAGFDNGLKIIGTVSDEIPTVTMQLTIQGGHKMDANDRAKAGLASMTAGLLNESTENYSAEEIQKALERLGSRVSVFAGNSSTSVSISSLKKNLDETLELAEEILMRPAFKEEDFARIKQQQMEGIKANQKDPASVASQVFNRLLYGKDHIYSMPTSGTEETVENITLEDVKAFYQSYYTPSLAELVIVGDISEEEVMAKLDFLKNWESKEVNIPEMPKSDDVDKTKVFLVDKAKAPQSQIRIGYVTDLTYDVTGDYFKSNLMNFALGGAFNSRINLNLREDKGWTYGARSYFSGATDTETAAFVASAGVKATASDSSVVEFMNEITQFGKEGITEEELSFMRNAVGQRDARSYETPRQKAGFLGRILRYDLDRSFVDEQAEIVQNISKKEIDALAKKYLKYDKMNILLVGDAESIRPKLEKLGYEIISLDEKGNPTVVRP